MNLHAVLIIFQIRSVVVCHQPARGGAWLDGLATGRPDGAHVGPRNTDAEFKHIDPFGTILIPLAVRVRRLSLDLGWAKPTPVTTRNFKHYPTRRHPDYACRAGQQPANGDCGVDHLVGPIAFRPRPGGGPS